MTFRALRGWVAGILVFGSLVVDAAVLPATARRVPRCGAQELTLRLELDRKVYPQGQPVRATLRVENTADYTCRAVFPSSQRAHIVFQHKRRRIYNEDRCHAFTDAIYKERWNPGHRDVYRWTWRKRDNRHRSPACGNGRSPRAPRGAYTVRAAFHGAYYKTGVLRSPRAWLRLR